MTHLDTDRNRNLRVIIIIQKSAQQQISVSDNYLSVLLVGHGHSPPEWPFDGLPVDYSSLLSIVSESGPVSSSENVDNELWMLGHEGQGRESTS